MINIAKNGNLTLNQIKEPIKLIDGSIDHFISPNGNVYKIDKHGYYLKKALHLRADIGYVYCGINYIVGGLKSRRVHKLVALTFIDNPDNLPVVGHMDNIKHNNNVSNLYWTTVSENTQKAIDDGLMVNDIGISDSQSNPIACYKNDGTLVGVYGSISEAGRCIEGSTKSSIAKVVDKTIKGTKGYYYKSISNDFYNNFPDLQKICFDAGYIKKKRLSFEIYKDNVLLEVSDNQKRTALKYGLDQARISNVLNHKGLGHLNGYLIKLI